MYPPCTPIAPPSCSIIPCPRLCELDAPNGILHLRSPLPLPYTKLRVKSLFLPTAPPPPTPGLAPLYPQGDPLGGGDTASSPSSPCLLRELRVPLSTASSASSGSFPPGLHNLLTLLHLRHADPTHVRWSSLLTSVLGCPNLVDLDISNCVTSPPPAMVAPGGTRDANLLHYLSQDPDGGLMMPHAHHARLGAMQASHAHMLRTHTSPWPLQKFACNGTPGGMYILLHMNALQPVRELREFSANSVQCVIGRLLALLTEQPHLQTVSLLGSSRCLSPPHVRFSLPASLCISCCTHHNHSPECLHQCTWLHLAPVQC